MSAPAEPTRLPPTLVVAPGGRAALTEDGRAAALDPGAGRARFEAGPVLVVHALLTAQRLGLRPPPRSPRLFDVLELFAFVRPARFCAPSPVGLALAMGWPEPGSVEAQAAAVARIAPALLAELAAGSGGRAEALAQAQTLERAGWSWAEPVLAALVDAPPTSARRGDGLEVWARLEPWEDLAPAGEPQSPVVAPEASAARLADLLARAGLDEARPAQAAYAAAATHAFQPRETAGDPRMMLAEAGTGVGKTLAYLAPASLAAEAGGGPVWVSTYTRALQRQIERESAWVFPEPAVRARKAVIRKGRENYLCLLNLQEGLNAARLGGGDLIGHALVARWAGASRDGDMTGGDFPAWLPGLFAVGPAAQASGANLVDRRGECIHAACPHYRVCFVEKAIRASRRADLVIANHALVMSQAAFDGARSERGARADAETATFRRIVFDEGHHLFDAADSAFSAAISGAEAAEMRRWIRGPEGRGRRGRGLQVRLDDLLAEHPPASEALERAVAAALALPGEGWSGRIVGQDGAAAPAGPVEAFLAAALAQLRARSGPSTAGMECAAEPATEAVRAAAATAAAAVRAVTGPLLVLADALEDMLDAEAEDLDTAQRARLQGAARGLDRRARMILSAWTAMLEALAAGGGPDPGFVDWFDSETYQGRLVDIAFRRHYVDPTEPLAIRVLAPAHGVLVTSATLADPGAEAPFALATLRSGASRLPSPPATLRLASPFDYARQALALVVTDVARDDSRQVAAAMRELFLAAGGGALGLFTAIARLRAVHALIAPELAARGLALHAQHVDALEVGALVDIFRAEADSCLLGTDAVRDGVDVPGRSLRLLAFDRVPWPRPNLLHKARRARFGDKAYDDAVARGRIAQAFGRLIRRADDRGVFVMLDAATPSRLLLALPEGVTAQRVGLVEALDLTRAHLAEGGTEG